MSLMGKQHGKSKWQPETGKRLSFVRTVMTSSMQENSLIENIAQDK